MKNETRDSQAGVSFRDVANLARRVGAEHSGHVRFVLDLPVRSGSGVILEVRSCFRRANGRPAEWVDIRGVSAKSPSGQSSTFAGLLFRLAYDLSALLDEDLAEAERAARG